MTLKDQIKQQFEEASRILNSFQTEDNFIKIQQAILILTKSLKAGNKIISCGNGGSMCDAMHFAEELSGRFRNNRKGLAAISISDPSHLTCVANDYGFDYVFSRFIEAVAQPGDVLLGISTSGNSRNIILANEKAKEIGMKTIVLTGTDGGKLANQADLEIRAPYSEYADRAQEIHIKVIHNLILGIENEMGV
jgi:D-sedoheptulose 7-phosphate isomerase